MQQVNWRPNVLDNGIEQSIEQKQNYRVNLFVRLFVLYPRLCICIRVYLSDSVCLIKYGRQSHSRFFLCSSLFVRFARRQIICQIAQQLQCLSLWCACHGLRSCLQSCTGVINGARRLQGEEGIESSSTLVAQMMNSNLETNIALK